MKLTINAAPREVSAPADTPLLWVLRDELGMTGTKFGCGRSEAKNPEQPSGSFACPEERQRRKAAQDDSPVEAHR